MKLFTYNKPIEGNLFVFGDLKVENNFQLLKEIKIKLYTPNIIIQSNEFIKMADSYNTPSTSEEIITNLMDNGIEFKIIKGEVCNDERKEVLDYFNNYYCSLFIFNNNIS